MRFKQVSLFIIMVVMAVLLVGCGPVYNTSYRYQAPQSMQGKRCIIQCNQARSQCQQTCDQADSQCQQLAMQRAKFQYAEYRSQQRLAGQPMRMDLSDFYNPNSCSDSCNCSTQFNSCYTMCGGQVFVIKKCVAFCGRNKG